MSASILSGIFSFFTTKTQLQPTPAAFRSARTPAPALPAVAATPIPQTRPTHTRWLLIEFGTSPESKRFKRVVQDALTNTIEGCSAATVARMKANGRAVIVSFSAADYATQYTDFAFNHFNTTLEIFAMNAGGIAFLTPDATQSSRVWRDCTWREVVTPQHQNGEIVGYILAGDIGMRITQ